MLASIRGCYQLVLPDAWRVLEEAQPSTLVAEPPSGNVQLVVSVLPPLKRRMDREFAVEALRQFLQTWGAEPVREEDIVVVRDRGQERRFVEVRLPDRAVFVGVLLFGRRIVLASGEALEATHDDYRACRELITSITPWRRFG